MYEKRPSGVWSRRSITGSQLPSRQANVPGEANRNYDATMKPVFSGENLVRQHVVASLQTGLEIPRITMAGRGIRPPVAIISPGGTTYAPLRASQCPPMIGFTQKFPTGETTANH